MSALLRVMWREIMDRRLLLLAGVGVGILPVLLTLDRGLESQARACAATAVAVGLVSGLALGASVIGRDLFTQRLAFYYVRPISSWALVGGKLLAAIAMTLIMCLLAMLPTGVLRPAVLDLASGMWAIEIQNQTHALVSWGAPYDGYWLMFAPTNLVAALWIAAVAVVVGLGHTAVVVYRSRSNWAAIDILALVALVVGLSLSLPVIARYIAVGGPRAQWFVWAPPATAFIVAALGPFVLGHTDHRRVHVLLTWILWPALGAWACALVQQSSRVWFAPPGQVKEVQSIQPAPRGGWAIVEASLVPEAFSGSFLLDSQSGQLLSSLNSGTGGVFSADGRRAVWQVGAPLFGAHRAVAFADLSVGARPSGPWPLPHFITWFVLSPAGDRMFAATVTGFVVYDVASGREVVGERAGPGCSVEQATFIGPERVRAFCRRGDGDFTILEINAQDGIVQTVGRVERPDAKVPEGYAFHSNEDRFVVDGSSSRMAFVATTLAHCSQRPWPKWRRLVVAWHDARSGALLESLLATTVEAEWLSSIRVRILAGGQVAVLDRMIDRLYVIASGGSARWDLPDVDCIGGQPDEGRLLICRGNDVLLLDVFTGRVLRREPDLVPMSATPPLEHHRDASLTVPAGEYATRLFVESSGTRARLVEVDLDTGLRRLVFPIPRWKP
jgi:hypothetical protein